MAHTTSLLIGALCLCGFAAQTAHASPGAGKQTKFTACGCTCDCSGVACNTLAPGAFKPSMCAEPQIAAYDGVACSSLEASAYGHTVSGCSGTVAASGKRRALRGSYRQRRHLLFPGLNVGIAALIGAEVATDAAVATAGAVAGAVEAGGATAGAVVATGDAAVATAGAVAAGDATVTTAATATAASTTAGEGAATATAATGAADGAADATEVTEAAEAADAAGDSTGAGEDAADDAAEGGDEEEDACEKRRRLAYARDGRRLPACADDDDVLERYGVSEVARTSEKVGYNNGLAKGIAIGSVGTGTVLVGGYAAVKNIK